MANLFLNDISIHVMLCRRCLPTLSRSLFVHYELVKCLLTYCSLALYKSPNGSYQAHNLYYSPYGQECVSLSALDPYQQRNSQTILANDHTSEYHDPHSLDTSDRSPDNNGLLRVSMLDIPLFLFVHVFYFLSAWYLPQGTHSFLRAHLEHCKGLLYAGYRRSKGTLKKVYVLCDRGILQRSIGYRFSLLNHLHLSCLKILAVSRYKRPVDFNRVERAFLIQTT